MKAFALDMMFQPLPIEVMAPSMEDHATFVANNS